MRVGRLVSQMADPPVGPPAGYIHAGTDESNLDTLSDDDEFDSAERVGSKFPTDNIFLVPYEELL